MSNNLKQDLSIGHTLKILRKNAGYTQEQASAQMEVLGLDMTPAILAKIEQGRYSIKISVLLAMKQIYRVNSFDEFFHDLF